MKVSHGSGAMGYETMAVVMHDARPLVEEIADLMPQILTQTGQWKTPSHR